MKYDILIKNGTIVDGTGNNRFVADIAVKDDKISKLSYTIYESAKKIIDAKGLVVCPGFIDIHSHTDFSIPYENKLQSIVTQGITTSVVGQCGSSLAPISKEGYEIFMRDAKTFGPPGVDMEITWMSFKEYLTAIEETKISSNIVPLVGFSAIRIAGGPAYENRKPTEEELEKMKSFVRESMDAGAFGLSTGLIYSPQVYAKTEEVIELAKVVAECGGLYFSHIRDEGPKLVESVEEAIEIVKKSGCRGGQIAHHKASGSPNWGKSRITLRLIEEANKEGYDISCDQYPYNRSATSLMTILPDWSHEGGIDEILRRLASEEDRKKMRKDLLKKDAEGENWYESVGPQNIYISAVKTEKWRDVEGKNIAEITKLRNKKDGIETIFDMLLEEDAEVSITIQSMNEEEIRQIMKNKYTMIGTDGWAVAPKGVMSFGKPHPRFYGSFPRIIRRYVREEGLLVLEEAIRKMSSMAAQKLGLFNRGIIREGMVADIVIFDYEKIYDKATFDDPHKFSEGIEYVIINGKFVIEDGKQTGSLPGKVIKYNQKK